VIIVAKNHDEVIMADLTGKALGRFQILQLLGQGGLANIYKSLDSAQNRIVAVKVIFPYFEPTGFLLERFLAEAETLKKLNHPNIVRLIDVGVSEGKPYIAMEYISGGTLKNLMTKPMYWQDALHLISPIARAIEYIHKHGVIHRDIKPSNILITDSGEPLLSDFGLAQVIHDAVEDAIGSSGIVGTPDYMAPEQAFEQKMDSRADIYALGVVLYEMITGRVPFNADTPIAVLFQKMTNPVPKPTNFVKDLPEELEKILLTALAKDPNDRYSGMGDLADAIEKLFDPTYKFKSIQDTSNRKLRIFLCHASEDKMSVREFYRQLTIDGFDVWLDEEKLLPGQEWDLEIRKAVRASDIVIICLSNNSISKEGYIQKEIRTALDVADEKPEGTIYLIPARLEDCDVPSRLSMWQWVDIFKEREYEKLLRALQVRADVVEAQKYTRR
jgi:serine/threonine protein kinase